MVDLVPPRLIRKWWSEQHCELVRPADLDVGELKNHLRFQGSYGAQEGMGGLVASHIGAVQTLRGGALMHLGHVTADIFEEESLSIRQLNVCSAVKGSEQGGGKAVLEFSSDDSKTSFLRLGTLKLTKQ